MSARARRRFLVALASGPLYRPTLELVVGISERDSTQAARELLAGGFVEIATDIGPATYRITDVGRAELERMRGEG